MSVCLGEPIYPTEGETPEHLKQRTKDAIEGRTHELIYILGENGNEMYEGTLTLLLLLLKHHAWLAYSFRNKYLIQKSK